MGAIEIRAPEGEGSKASLTRWLVAVGDVVERDQPLAEMETDKVAVEVSAPGAGVVAELLAGVGADVEPGEVIARLATAAAPPTTPSGHPLPQARESTAYLPPEREGEGHETRLSPAVRRALAERGLRPEAIAGTGKDGRITLADVEAAGTLSPALRATPLPQAGEGQVARQRDHGEGTHGPRRIPHTTMRRRIAERMALSVQAAPHVTALIEVDFTAVLAHRAVNKAAFFARGAPLTITAYIVQAAVAAMRAQPHVNAHWGEDAMTLFEDVNIGVGTAVGQDGLLVPVLKRAQALSLEGTAAALHDLTERARANRLAPADVQGGTFSISNHGVSGTLLAAPVILVPPQVAILGVGKLEKRVVVREIDGADAIQIRPAAYVTLTIDHRALDGAATNAWLAAFKAAIEGWA